MTHPEASNHTRDLPGSHVKLLDLSKGFYSKEMRWRYSCLEELRGKKRRKYQGYLETQGECYNLLEGSRVRIKRDSFFPAFGPHTEFWEDTGGWGGGSGCGWSQAWGLLVQSGPFPDTKITFAFFSVAEKSDKETGESCSSLLYLLWGFFCFVSPLWFN